MGGRGEGGGDSCRILITTVSRRRVGNKRARKVGEGGGGGGVITASKYVTCAIGIPVFLPNWQCLDRNLNGLPRGIRTRGRGGLR